MGLSAGVDCDAADGWADAGRCTTNDSLYLVVLLDQPVAWLRLLHKMMLMFKLSQMRLL